MHEWIGPILNSLQLIREFLFIADMVLVSISESGFQNVFFKFRKLNHESTHKKILHFFHQLLHFPLSAQQTWKWSRISPTAAVSFLPVPGWTEKQTSDFSRLQKPHKRDKNQSTNPSCYPLLRMVQNLGSYTSISPACSQVIPLILYQFKNPLQQFQQNP